MDNPLPPLTTFATPGPGALLEECRAHRRSACLHAACGDLAGAADASRRAVAAAHRCIAETPGSMLPPLAAFEALDDCASQKGQP